MTTKNILVGQQETMNMPVPTGSAFANAVTFEAAQRMAKALVSSDMVPAHYQGPDNLGNAIIALEMAQRINASPLMVMQNLYMVHGNPSWSAKFLIATFNQSGKYSSLKYEWKGDPGKPDYGCRAYCTERATGEKIEGPWITWELVKAEGWDGKKGSKWKTMAGKMFLYRAAAWLIDVTAPEISMGLPTAEEAEDMIHEVDGEVVAKGADVKDALTGEVETAEEQEAKKPAKKKAAKKKAAPKPQATQEAAPETVPPEPWDDAGNSTQAQEGLITAPSYAEIANGINKATSKEDLDAFMDQAGHLPPEQVDELAGLCNAQMARFES